MDGLSASDERAAYEENGYVLLTKLFPPVVLSVFHGRLRHDLNLQASDAFVSQTALLTKPALEVYSRQYPPMAAFLWGMTPTVARIAGRKLIPTYAYFRIYQQDDICRVHSDREACEHSLSLTVELADRKPWALAVGRDKISEQSPIEPDFGSEEYTALPMNAGDGVMYQGVGHRHGRLDPNPNRWSAHLFMHWVDANGPYADQAFDRVNFEKMTAKA